VNVWLSGSAWVRTLVTVGVLAYLLTRIDVGASVEAMGRLSLTTALAILALVALDRMVMVWRWVILLRPPAPTCPRSPRRGSISSAPSSGVSFRPAWEGMQHAPTRSPFAHPKVVKPSRRRRRSDSGLLSILVMGAIGLVAAGSQVGPGSRIVLVAGLALVAGATACSWG
jgi:hypothetical protein